MLALGAVGAGILVPGSAAGEQARPGAPQGSADHYAGSQIARHERATYQSAVPPAPPSGGPSTDGMDVSRHQGDVDWSKAAHNGARFSYVKATEGTDYTSPAFAAQFSGAEKAGMVRGAYHFALPNSSSGREQADFFASHGGAWAPDGKTLPPALDLEYNPYGRSCYGMNHQQMIGWISDFSDRMLKHTGRYPAIYTSTAWWDKCTGGATEFARNSPLWIPRYGSSVGKLPAGWSLHTIWQYDDSGRYPGDQNYFNGTEEQLRKLAKG